MHNLTVSPGVKKSIFQSIKGKKMGFHNCSLKHIKETNPIYWDQKKKSDKAGETVRAKKYVHPQKP